MLAALLPFIPWLIVAPGGLSTVPLPPRPPPADRERPLGTPLFVAHLLGRLWIEVGTSYGSQSIDARGRGLHGAAVGAADGGRAGADLRAGGAAPRAAARGAAPPPARRCSPRPAPSWSSARSSRPEHCIWLRPGRRPRAARRPRRRPARPGDRGPDPGRVPGPLLEPRLPGATRPSVCSLVRNGVLVATFVAALARLWMLTPAALGGGSERLARAAQASGDVNEGAGPAGPAPQALGRSPRSA